MIFFPNNCIQIKGLFLCCIFTLGLNPLFAQFANTLVKGTLKNANMVKEIDLYVNSKYLDNNNEVYTSNILEDGTFAFACEIKEPQLVILEYARNKTLIYLEPNDTLLIDADGNSFQYSLQFSGRSGFNNTFYAQYLKDNPAELDRFKLTQYQYGKYWYSNSPEMDIKMMSKEPDLFRRDMTIRKEKAMDMLAFFRTEHGSKITKQFDSFMEAEILYNYGYHMFLYGHVFKNKYKTPPEFFDFIKDIKKQNPHIGNYWYREYLKAFVNHRFMEDKKTTETGSGSGAASVDKEENLYLQLLDVAKQDFYGKELNYYQSEVITWAFKKKDFDKIEDSYYEFTKTNPYPQLEDKVMSVYHEAKKYAEGTQAPSFTIKGLEGEDISLNNYDGKVVFLNFWASWCKPCMTKMVEMQPVVEDLEKKGIVFLNISLDRKKETWQNTLSKNNFKGIHALSDGSANTDITRSYQVSVLPHYFIINKNGAFAEKPKQYNLETLKSHLESLNKR